MSYYTAPLWKSVSLYSAFKSIHRKCLLILLTAVLALAGCDSGSPKNPGALTVKDGRLTDSSGNPVQLRGMSTHGIAWFPQYVSTEAFAFVQNCGGNVVRIAMYTDTENGYLADPEYNEQLVRQAVTDALALGMYVIVDWHILSDGNPMDHVSEAADFFRKIAHEYRNEPHVLYEIANEPNRAGWDDITEYADTIIPIIRKENPAAVVIVGTPEYSSSLHAAMQNPLSYDNILYAYHFYAGEKISYRELNKAVEARFPVMVSEWGIGLDGDGTPAIEAGRQFVSYLNEQGLSWCAWSFCNKDESYSLLRPDCDKLESFTMQDLSNVGKVYAGAMKGES